jgi:hypothetical protein
VIVALAVLVILSAAPPPAPTPTDADLLRSLHEKVLRAHRSSDVELILEDEPEDYVVAARGEITRPTRGERRARLGTYLASTRFEEYRDVVEPVVTVSADGTLGWVVVQVRARGVQTAEPDETPPLEFVSAWIELYAKREGRWYRVGNVSNFKPDAATPPPPPPTAEPPRTTP